jgi:hypothetical protein
MAFGENKDLLATGGAKRLRVWDLSTWTEIVNIPTPALCMTLAFLGDDSFLWIALKNNTILIYDMIEKSLRDGPIDWTGDFGEEGAPLRLRRPTLAKFCPKQNLLAIVYRGENILLWGLDEGGILDMYEKDYGSLRNGEPIIADGSTTVWAIEFSTTLEHSLLIASYSDGDVVVFCTDTGERQDSIDGINALALSCSPDGRTLATADSQGNICLFDLRTLKFLYRLSFDTDAIRTKRLSFTMDNLRLLDIRGNQFRVWDPTILLRQEFEDENSDTVSISTNPQEVDYKLSDQIQVTCITCIRHTSAVLCGKEDGSVHAYTISGELQSRKLFVQTPNCAITMLHFDEDTGTITCCDLASRVTSRSLQPKHKDEWDIGDLIVDLRNESAVSQVLCSAKHKRLLVSTERHDTLWSLNSDDGTGQIAQIKGNLKPSWLSPTSNSELLLHIDSDTASFYRWSTLEKFRSIKLSTHETAPIHVDSISTFHHEQYFATVHYESQSSPTQDPKYHIWDLRDFVLKNDSESGDQQNVATIFPLFDFGLTKVKVELLIGVANDRAVFLGANNWVYSTDMNNDLGLGARIGADTSSSAGSAVTRHFFFPDDWCSSINRTLVDIRRSGEMIFVKRSELAVIRRGLEVSEHGTLNAHRGLAARQALAKRPADKRHISV